MMMIFSANYIKMINIVLQPLFKTTRIQAMLGKDLSPGKGQNMGKTVYGDLDQKDYARILQQKNKTIHKLQYKVQRLQKQKDELMKVNSGGANSFYKKKLQQQIKDNEAATQLLLSIGVRMQKLIQMLRLGPQKCEDSTEVKNILKLMGDGHGHEEEHLDLDDSQMENMDAVQSQVLKKLQDLQSVCDLYHKNYNKMQKEYSNTDTRLKQIKKQNEQQTRTLQKQLKQQTVQKQHFKALQQKSQNQKKQILRNIANSIDPKLRKQIQNYNKQQLLEYIKGLFFKIGELEKTKTEVLRENKKIKTADLEKYRQMLNQVREVKEVSKMGHSVM